MKPIKVKFQAFGPYALQEEVDFEAISSRGLFLICGKTGTGKTMILDAITFALYGKSSGHGRDDFASMRCQNADSDTDTFVSFEFENNGDYYIFERRLERKRKKLSQSYNLMKKDENGVYRVLLENAKEKELNSRAVEIIGLEYEQFRQVIVLPQGQFEKLLTSNSDEKEKILTSIFGETRWQAIADKFYEEVAKRRDSLRTLKEKIENSLSEEECTSIDDLLIKINLRKSELETVVKEYEVNDYDRVLDEQRQMLALVRRFEDLNKARVRVTELDKEKDDIKGLELKIKDALRAEKVRVLIDDLAVCDEQYNTRKNQEETAALEVSKAKKLADAATELFDSHILNEKSIEEKRTRKIQYENKRPDYVNINKVVDELLEKTADENKALSDEEAAKQKYEVYAPEILKLNEEYSVLDNEHRGMLNKYIAGISGELAAKLKDGEACPVCGSITHPNKAIPADDSVTKKMVDDKRAQADSKLAKLNNTTREQENAKKHYDEMHIKVEHAHTEVVSVTARLDNMKENLISDIESLDDLDEAINNIDNSIKLYDDKKNELMFEVKMKADAYTEAKARLISAKQETKASLERHKEAGERLAKGLLANDFENEEAARAVLLDPDEIERIRNKTAKYNAEVKAANDTLNLLIKELDGKTEPDEEICNRIVNEVTEIRTEYTEKKAILENNIERLENKYKNLNSEGEGIEEKIHQTENDYVFAKKLRGDTGTGIQRYVLGVMFSSVVVAANKMLEHVHGGRYRLYRTDDKAQGSNKRGLELKVYDKHSEDGNGRFVSTLSGGEKFLASLALSIGMSTVAQKSGIKINALFIDEGFGSLDEDSISDAMNILNSIQEANGLVGIISHVQLLQERIPTKLKVVEVEKGSHIVKTIG